MKGKRLIDARFLNSMVYGLADVLFKWDGAPYGVMGYNVGKDLLDEMWRALDFERKSKEEAIRELGRQLVETYQVADSMEVTENKEDDCVEVRVENCVLLPFMRKMLKRNPMLKSLPLCVVNNMIMGVLENKGDNTELRSYRMNGNQCHSIIGLIEELPMEKELRRMKRKQAKFSSTGG